MSSSLRPCLERLRKSLRHSQICTNEYEALRRELSSLNPKTQREDMLAAALKTTRKIVDEKVVKDLLGDELGIRRTLIQVITEITHRLNTAEEDVIRLEEQIEEAQNEVDPDEEDEEDEYEPVDNTKYQPTAEGLATPEVQKELEEFRKRVHIRGEESRAEAALAAGEEDQEILNENKRRGGVRFVHEPDEEESAEKDTPNAKDLIETNSGSGIKSDSQNKPDSVNKPGALDFVVPDTVHNPNSDTKPDSVDKPTSMGEGPSSSRKHASDTEDEYSKPGSSTAEGERQPPKRVMLTTVNRSLALPGPPDLSVDND